MDSEIAPALQRLTSALRQAQDVSVQIGHLMRQAEEEAAEPFRGCGHALLDMNSNILLISNPNLYNADTSNSTHLITVVHWLLFKEMLPNARSEIVKEIHQLNTSFDPDILFSTVFTLGHEKNKPYVLTSMTSKAMAYLLWKTMVQSGAPWDHKSDVLREFGGWCRDETGYYYRYDIWSNIHYGFVGRAAGFTAQELKIGAGIAQITDGTSDPSYWKFGFDEPGDQIAIQIGVDLFDKCGLNVSIVDFLTIFYQSSHLLPRIQPPPMPPEEWIL